MQAGDMDRHLQAKQGYVRITRRTPDTEKRPIPGLRCNAGINPRRTGIEDNGSVHGVSCKLRSFCQQVGSVRLRERSEWAREGVGRVRIGGNNGHCQGLECRSYCTENQYSVYGKLTLSDLDRCWSPCRTARRGISCKLPRWTAVGRCCACSLMRWMDGG